MRREARNLEFADVGQFKEVAVTVKLGSGLLSDSLTAAQTRAEEAAREVRQQLAAAA